MQCEKAIDCFFSAVVSFVKSVAAITCVEIRDIEQKHRERHSDRDRRTDRQRQKEVRKRREREQKRCFVYFDRQTKEGMGYKRRYIFVFFF